MALPTDAHARARNNPFVDRVAHRCAGRARAFGAHVALGGESSHQVGFRRLLGQNRAPGNGLFHRLQVLRAGMQKQVHVRIDQPRQQRGVAKVDDLCAPWVIDCRANSFDPLALDENLAGTQHISRIHLQQSRRVQNNRTIC